MKDLKASNLAKAGAAVGIDVLEGHVSPHSQVTKQDLDDYFASKKYTGEYIKKLYDTPDGKEILEIMAPLLSGKRTPEEIVRDGKGLHKEIIEEGPHEAANEAAQGADC
jgi:hypothetical protein